MIKHRHSEQTRHIRKGGVAKISGKKVGRHYEFDSYFTKGKKQVKVTGRLSAGKKSLKGKIKVNPFRRNPPMKTLMQNIKKTDPAMKKYVGHTAGDLTGLFIGGASVPFFNKFVSKYLPGAVNMFGGILGPQNTGAVIPIVGGVIFNLIAEIDAVKKMGALHTGLRTIGEGMAAAGVVGLAMGVSQQNILPAVGSYVGLAGIPHGLNGIPHGLGIYPQLNGVEYTPNMSGINYTPAMSGVEYTPMSGADFGAADYGGGGGSVVQTRADFGADWSQDSIADHWGTEDDELSSAMN